MNKPIILETPSTPAETFIAMFRARNVIEAAERGIRALPHFTRPRTDTDPTTTSILATRDETLRTLAPTGVEETSTYWRHIDETATTHPYQVATPEWEINGSWS